MTQVRSDCLKQYYWLTLAQNRGEVAIFMFFFCLFVCLFLFSFFVDVLMGFSSQTKSFKFLRLGALWKKCAENKSKIFAKVDVFKETWYTDAQ